MKQLLSFLDPRQPYGGPLGRISGPLALLVALLALLLPVGPVSLTAPGGDGENRRGDASLFRVEAGAGIDYESPAPFLRNLGIAVEEKWLAAGNYTSGGINPRAIVIHNTDSPASMGCNPVYNTFAGPSQSSTHFCIDANGGIQQYVALGSIAWGNGDVCQADMSIPLIQYVVGSGTSCAPQLWMNQYTWSIELALDYSPNTEYAESFPRMMESLAALVKFLALQGGFPPDRDHVLTHRDINGSNRVDPICCWRVGGLAAGAQAFDSWVASLSAVVEPPSPTFNMSAIRVYQAGGAMFYVAGGELAHIPSVEALATLWPYEVLPLSATVYQRGEALYVAAGGELAYVPDSVTLDKLWPYTGVRVEP